MDRLESGKPGFGLTKTSDYPVGQIGPRDYPVLTFAYRVLMLEKALDPESHD